MCEKKPTERRATIFMKFLVYSDDNKQFTKTNIQKYIQLERKKKTENISEWTKVFADEIAARIEITAIESEL